MLLTPIVSRLSAQCPTLTQALYALSGAVPVTYPAAYVLPLSETAGENPLLGVHSQIITSRFGIEIMLKHASQAASGGPAAELLESVRAEVMAALKGWQPSPAYDPIAFVSGRLVEFQAGMAVWRDEFSTRFDSRS
jgi:hypothetical protein